MIHEVGEENNIGAKSQNRLSNSNDPTVKPICSFVDYLLQQRPSLVNNVLSRF